MCDFNDFFFFNDTATTEIYTLSLHDALPILVRYPSDDAREQSAVAPPVLRMRERAEAQGVHRGDGAGRSEEHTSELQSRQYLVCRLLLEKKKLLETLQDTCLLQTLPLIPITQ